MIKVRRSMAAGMQVFSASFMAFFVLTMPFRHMFRLVEVTEVRPASALPPVCGILFGLPGVLGCTGGNLAADLLSGSPVRLCFPAAVIEFFYGVFPGIFWKWLFRGKAFHLNRVKDVMWYLGITVLNSFISAVLLGLLIELCGYREFLMEIAVFMFFNNLVFGILLGIPLLIVFDYIRSGNRQKVFSLNVRFVLIFLFLAMISSITVGAVYYYTQSGNRYQDMILWNRLYLAVALEFFLFGGISLGFLRYMEKNITIPIEKLSMLAAGYADAQNKRPPDSRKMIAKCEKLSVLPGEPGQLAEAFCKMLSDVDDYVKYIRDMTAEKERMNAEINVASRLQADMLPKAGVTVPEREEFCLEAWMSEVGGVGGDFYDYFLLDDDHLAFLVADVSGKGIPGALFMVMAKTLLFNYTKKSSDFAQALMDVNNSLCDNNRDSMFVTAWIGILTLSSGRLVFINAGHNPPLVKKGKRGFQYVTRRSGPFLAGMENTSYQTFAMKLEPGDQIFVYSDGVTEAHDSRNGLFGEERLKQCLNQCVQVSPEEQISCVWREVEKFRGAAERFDDITMLALHYRGDGYKKYTVNVELGRTQQMEEYVEKILSEADVPEEIRLEIKMAVDELYSNICRYSQASEATVACKVRDGAVRMYFEDNGIAFNPLEKEEPDVTMDLYHREIGGLGIFMVRQMMAEMYYEHVAGKNRLFLKRCLENPGALDKCRMMKEGKKNGNERCKNGCGTEKDEEVFETNSESGGSRKNSAEAGGDGGVLQGGIVGGKV